MEMYVREDVTGSVFLVEYDGEKMKLLDCDSPSLIKRGLILSDHTIKFGKKVGGRLMDNGQVLLVHDTAFIEWGHTITPNEAYHLACLNAPTRDRFPLRFIREAGLRLDKPEAIPSIGYPIVSGDDPAREGVNITSVLDTATKGHVILVEHLGRLTWAVLLGHQCPFLAGPQEWNEAIRAACTWWEEHRPEA